MANAITITIQKITKKNDNKVQIEPEKIKTIDQQTDQTKLSFELKAANSDFQTSDEVIVTYTVDGATTPINAEGNYTIGSPVTKISIEELKPAPGITLNFVGQIKVGDPNADPLTNDAIMLSVRFGNMNKNKDWIIDLADKTNGAPGTYIKLTKLINWVNSQNSDPKNKDISGSTAVSIVALEKPGGLADGDFDKINKEDFTIEIKALRFNITQKTFRIEVASKDEETITFGAFTIMKVGLLLTNERWTEEETKAISQ